MDIKDVISYDPFTGILTRKINRAKHLAGEVVGSVNGNGYLTTKFKSKSIKCHQIAWFLTYDYWPKEIDHIDGNRLNNKLENLREVTRQENVRNTQVYKNSPFNIHGISKRGNKYRAYITVNNKLIQLGSHLKLETAIIIRKAAEAWWGFHPNHSRLSQGEGS